MSENPESFYTLKEVSIATGLSADTLRFYEKDGLLPDVKRLANGHRTYSQQNMDWLNFVVCLRSTGMSLKHIKHYLNLIDQGEDTVPERIDLLRSEQDRIKDEIATLNKALKRLENKVTFYKGEQDLSC